MPKSKPAKAVSKKKTSKTKPVAKKSARPAAKPAAKAVKPAKPAKATVKSRAAVKIPAKAGRMNGGSNGASSSEFQRPAPKPLIPDSKLSPFLRKQKERLVHLRDSMVDSMLGVAKDTLRSRAEGSEASAFGMHQADAGSDAYDRDFALSLLSQRKRRDSRPSRM